MGEKGRLSQIARRHSYVEGFNGRLAKYRIRKIQEHLTVNDHETALEIGAGEGQVTRYLVKVFDNLISLEPAGKYFKILYDKNVDTDNMDCYQETFEDFETNWLFDAIFMIGVLEHVCDPVEFLHKAGDLLTEGGRLFITVPNAESLHRRLYLKCDKMKTITEMNDLDRKVGHRRYYTREALYKDLVAAGFLNAQTEGIFLKFFNNSGMEHACLSDDFCDALYDIGNELPEYCAEIFAIATK